MRKMIGLFGGLTVIFFLLFSTLTLQAQTYPSYPIQMVIPMAPGDTVDLTGRVIGAELSKILKTPVLPINKPGGGSTLGADSVAKGKKDGYTLLYANSNIYYAPAMNPEAAPYHPLKDLEPLCLAVSVPLTIPVQADAPWKTFREMIEYIKQNPGKIRGSSSGVGSVGHCNFEVIRIETGAAITQIPYKGASPAMTALLGGHVEISTLSLSLISAHLKAGKLRLLLLSQKVQEFPDAPTLTQMGYKRDINPVRFAFYLPAGVPDSIKKVLSPALEKAIRSAEVIEAIQKLGAIPDYKPSEEFRKLMADEYETVKALMKSAGPSTN